jgi:hypothetical protein
MYERQNRNNVSSPALCYKDDECILFVYIAFQELQSGRRSAITSITFPSPCQPRIRNRHMRGLSIPVASQSQKKKTETIESLLRTDISCLPESDAERD